jgi:AcrR family transcriptional regulator
MFKDRAERATPRRAHSEDTRQQILQTALARFRELGFEAATMRDVAAAAGVSIGAAYYYFASKEAIVGAYYQDVHRQHESRSRAAFARSTGLRDRLRAVLHAKIDIVRDDRPLLRALFRYGGDADHPLSWFGPATQGQREASVALFGEALAGERLPADLQATAPRLLWALHMGVLLFFLHDGSTDQRRTRRLIDATVDLLVDVRRVVASPLVRPLRRRVFGLLTEAGLLPAPVRAGGAGA